MRTLGLTGGIGMGKSAAADWLTQQAVPVVDSDLLARRIVEPGEPALAEIRRIFGLEMLDSQGRLDRDALAAVVFADADARRKLEEITHPRIRHLWRAQFEVWRAEGRRMAVAVVPLLFEIQAQTEFDATICMACSAWTQRQRLLERGWNADQIENRLRAQLPVELKMASADYVIWTEGGLDLAAAQLGRILARF